MAKSKAVAKSVDNDLQAAMLATPVEASDFTKDDMAIPFLRILQKMSPQLSRKEGEYIEGAQEGMIMNTVTGQLWEQDEGVIVIPCKHIFKYILWKPRDSGGGFVTQYDRDSKDLPQTTKDDRNRDITPDGNILTPTSEHYVLIVDENEDLEPALISMSSTQLKVSRKWSALIDQQKMGPQKIKAHHYLNYFKLTTKDENNDQGSWCGWNFELLHPLSVMSHFTAAAAFRESVSGGGVRTEYKEVNAAEEVM